MPELALRCLLLTCLGSATACPDATPPADAGDEGSDADSADSASADSPPVISWSTPVDGAQVSGTVALEVTASDDEGVSKVEFLVDDVLLATATSAPFSATWDTITALNGNHVLRARATDTASKSAEAAIEIEVRNAREGDQPPTVTIIYPQPGSTVCGALNIEATAVDDHGVVEVSFLVDGAQIGVAAASPYRQSWDSASVANGEHTIEAVAKDTIDQRTRHLVTVTTNNGGGACDNPPAVTFSAPTARAVADGAVALEAVATDDVGVVKVQFFVDNAMLYEDTSAPFSASWQTGSYAEGPHAVKALAYDTASQTGEAVIQVALDRTPPEVSVTEPAAGAVFFSQSFQMSATASDAYGVARVEFRSEYGFVYATDLDAPFSATIEGPAAGGWLTVVARAYDAAGLYTDQAVANVAVCIGDYHDGGDGSCTAVGACAYGYHDGGDGSCVALGSCAAGFHAEGLDLCCPENEHDGGEGACLPLGSCADGYHDGGDGACVWLGLCSAGFHDGGGGGCVAVGTCAAEFHDGGDGTCVAAGTCADGYHDAGGFCCASGQHDGGDGTCAAAGSCADSYQDDGTGVCCPDGAHNGGDGTCVTAGTCALTFHDGGGGLCCPEGMDNGGGAHCVAAGTCFSGVASYTEAQIEADFVDIRGSGTLAPYFGWQDPAFSGPFPIGFTFPFFQASYDAFYIAKFGFMSFEPLDGDNVWATPYIPSSTSPNAIVAPFWSSELKPTTTGDNVYYTTLGAAPNRVFVLQWTNFKDYYQSRTATFQIKLHEDGHIEFQYADLSPDFPPIATTGIESGATAGDVVGSVVHDRDRFGEVSADFGVRFVRTLDSGFHDGGDGSCVPIGQCAATYVDVGAGLCCQAGEHDGGGGQCAAEGSCAEGYVMGSAGCAPYTVQVETGDYHTCALRSDGSVRCWGTVIEYSAAIAPGDLFSSLSQDGCGVTRQGAIRCWGAFGVAYPPPAGAFTQAAISGQHGCALDAAGAATCWGYNYYGSTEPPADAFTDICAGGSYSCGVRAEDGAITCWGINDSGQATPPAGSFTQLGCGDTSACAIAQDQTVSCWGQNYYGEASPPDGQFTQIDVGASYACGVLVSGEAVCWGTGYEGETTPPTASYVQVSVAGDHSCGVKADHTVTCWGSQRYLAGVTPGLAWRQAEVGSNHLCGLHGDGSVECVCFGGCYSGELLAPSGEFVDLDTSFSHNCGLRADGVVECWGDNASGASDVPPGHYTEVATAGGYACGIDESGAVICWGDANSPASFPPPGSFVSLDLGYNFGCAISSQQLLVCWDTYNNPVEGLPAGTFTQVSVGGDFGCALATDGTLACFGNSDWGRTDAPAGVFTELACGWDASCARRQDGVVVCWGNLRGYYVDYDLRPPYLTDFEHISLNQDAMACATRSDGTIRCWGRNGLILPAM